MRVTKTMRTVIEKRLTEKRLAADKTASQPYHDRCQTCSDEIFVIVERARKEAEDILRKYNMDTICKDWRGNLAGASVESIIVFNDSAIRNHDEHTALHDAESQRYNAQQAAIEEIIFDAEAGGDKETLLAAIAAVQF